MPDIYVQAGALANMIWLYLLGVGVLVAFCAFVDRVKKGRK